MTTYRSIPTALAALLVAAVLAVTAAGPAAVPARGADNIAVATNTRDGSSVYRLAFKILRVRGDVVDSGNAAVAAASCESCKTVAVAMETLLVFDEPSVFTPVNLALAMNVECSQCETLASAYQTVVQSDGPSRFTAAGNQRIAEVRRELQDLRGSDLSVWETQERLDAINSEMQDVLATELVSAGPPNVATPPVEAAVVESPVPATEESAPPSEVSTPTAVPVPDQSAGSTPQPAAAAEEDPATHGTDTATGETELQPTADAPVDAEPVSVPVAATEPEAQVGTESEVGTEAVAGTEAETDTDPYSLPIP